jgi:hypothetical protein
MATEIMNLRAHWGSWMIILAESTQAFWWPSIKIKEDEDIEDEE